jgi:choline dehydrogenase-like flavoprotein
MPAERVTMRQAREIIRLKFSACVPAREIARRLGVAASTVRETLKRFESAGLVWPLPADMTDGALESAVVSTRQRVWNVTTRAEIPNLYVMDSSIFPTSVGANPMQSIYTFAKIFASRFLNGMD